MLVVVLDGSGGRTAKKLAVPPNVVLHRQPNCTPELQPAGHLWPLVREGLANRVLETLPKLTEVPTARCQWRTDQGRRPTRNESVTGGRQGAPR